MDFIEQLLDSDGFTGILVVVERLTKLAIFVPVPGKLTSEALARVFLVHVFSKHGVPQHVTSDRGSEFVSHFFRSLGTLLDIKMHYTSGHHPEANGQAERVNQTLEQYLRLYCNYQQTNWSDLLPLAEFAYNNTPSDTTGVSPFFANKGYNPSISVHPDREAASLRAREMAIDIHELQEYLKTQILSAQKRYSEYANARREPPPDLQIGQHVYVDAQHIRTTRPARKLAEKYLGPFEILSQPGPQSFLLRLPEDYKSVHPIFHVSQLEPHFPSSLPHQHQDPPPPVFLDDEGDEHFEVSAILDSRLDKRITRRCPIVYLIQWQGYENTDQGREWKKAEDLAGAHDLIEAYHSQHSDRPGSYRLFCKYVKRLPDSDEDSDA